MKLIKLIPRYRARDLEDLPTLCIGQTCDLKMDNGLIRVWLCRCDVTDGMPYNDAITIERYDGRSWIESDMYPG